MIVVAVGLTGRRRVEEFQVVALQQGVFLTAVDLRLFRNDALLLRLQFILVLGALLREDCFQVIIVVVALCGDRRFRSVPLCLQQKFIALAFVCKQGFRALLFLFQLCFRLLALFFQLLFGGLFLIFQLLQEPVARFLQLRDLRTLFLRLLIHEAFFREALRFFKRRFVLLELVFQRRDLGAERLLLLGCFTLFLCFQFGALFVERVFLVRKFLFAALIVLGN